MPVLTWIGKDKVVNHHRDVPYRVLEHKYGFRAEDANDRTPTGSGNKIIHGDNLEALKSLLPEYEGRIKCIYIDPPYNTGNEKWVYNDNVNDPKIKKWLGEVVGKQGEDLSRHDKWLCMMYPRLKLLHKLLAEDGVIFISIDDNELANLKLLCDEIFGANNFITNICHKSRSSVSNDLILSPNHNLLLFYSKNADLTFGQRRQYRQDADVESFKLDDGDGKGKYKLVPVDGPGGAAKGNPYYEFLGISGYWRYSQETMRNLYANGEIIKRKTSLSRKYYLSKAIEKGGKSLTTWWDDAGSATNGTNLIKTIFTDKVFDTPKPIELLGRIIQIATDKQSIILDSFAGSGTTAHAVLNLNKRDGGNRKFILVEMEDYAEDITAERVRRVMQGYGEGKNATSGTGGAFDYYELGERMFDEEGSLNKSIGEEKIREYIYYTETKQRLERERTEASKYLLDTYNATGYYFYYERDRPTTLGVDTLHIVTERAEQYVIYADVCTLSKEDMAAKNIVFKKIPRDIKRF